MPIKRRNNVQIYGKGAIPMVFAHGFGCDQNVWRQVAPAFSEDYRVVLFDHVGSGNSDLAAYDRNRYDSLYGYAHDLQGICLEFAPEGAIFVGHSVGATIGMLAAVESPDLFRSLTMVSPSPCFINSDDYIGGFEREDISELLDLLDSNYLGWTTTLAKALMHDADRQDVEQELVNSFCRTDPDIARQFASATFLSDHRDELTGVRTPTLLLQTANDIIAPATVGSYMHDRIAGSQLVTLQASGHCPHLSDPAEVIVQIRRFLEKPRLRTPPN
jgi:sigma-B regulation protein RsbQ